MEGLRQEKRLVVLDLVLRTEYEYTNAYSVVKNFVGMHIHSKATAATQWGAMCNAEPPLLIRENAVQMDLVAKKTHAEEEGLLAPALSGVHLGFKTQLGFPQQVIMFSLFYSPVALSWLCLHNSILYSFLSSNATSPHFGRNARRRSAA